MTQNIKHCIFTIQSHHKFFLFFQNRTLYFNDTYKKERKKGLKKAALLPLILIVNYKENYLGNNANSQLNIIYGGYLIKEFDMNLANQYEM